MKNEQERTLKTVSRQIISGKLWKGGGGRHASDGITGGNLKLFC